MSLPEPLVPGEVDLTDFPYMPLEVRRLRDSDLATLAGSDEFRAAVLLWCAAWHQVPAGSLPNDDRLLAAICGYGRGPAAMRDWEAVREGALRGFILCSDGRLYHTTIAEKALSAWQEKLAYAARKAEHSERQRARARKRWDAADATADAGRIATADATAHAADMPMKGRRKGKGIEKEINLSSNAGALELSEENSKEPSEGYTADFEEWWKAYPRRDGKGAAFRSYRAAKKRTTVERLLEGAKAYAKARQGQDPRYTKQGATWLNGDCWNDEPTNVVPIRQEEEPRRRPLTPEEARIKFEKMETEGRERAKREREEQWARHERER